MGLICISEGRALSRPSYVAATERGPPNESTPFVAVSIVRIGSMYGANMSPKLDQFQLTQYKWDLIY